MIVLPAIDLRNGLCVRLLQGDFARETVYRDDPVALAREYRRAGFDHLHLVDLDGARDGRPGNEGTIRTIVAEAGTTVQVGGGIRGRAAVERWLASGAARCVVGSVAVHDPDTVAGWIREFGGERIVPAFDVRCPRDGEPVAMTEGWTQSSGLTLRQCIDRYVEAGVRHVLCTDVGRDGTLAGPNLDLYRDLVERYPGIGVQASGGVRNDDDLAALARLGCAAAITGRALLEGMIRTPEAAPCRRGA